MTTEEWTPTQYHGYATSNQGRVFSWKRGKYLKEKDCEEYTKVKINGKWRFTHLVILEAFLGPKPEQLDTLHLNSNPRDNSIKNLKYGTRTENIRMSNVCKLKESQVRQILESNLPQKQLASKFKISQGHVSTIKRRKCWGNIKHQTSLDLG